MNGWFVAGLVVAFFFLMQMALAAMMGEALSLITVFGIFMMGGAAVALYGVRKEVEDDVNRR